MPIQPAMLTFADDDRAAVLDAMQELAGTGVGWINFEPDVDPDDLPPGDSGLFRFLSARGPDVPLCTWSPPEQGTRHPYVSLGVQHGMGGGAVKYLEQLGLGPDPRWRVLQDQPRKGTVVAVPVDEDNDEVLLWLLAAGTALCPAPFGGRWNAGVYRRAS